MKRYCVVLNGRFVPEVLDAVNRASAKAEDMGRGIVVIELASAEVERVRALGCTVTEDHQYDMEGATPS